jgi:hypothetical protein
MQNWFATFALLSWPLASLYLYLTRSLQTATIWTILAAQCLLPVGAFIKIEMIPTFDKTSVPNLCIFFGCLAARRSLQIFRRFGLTEILIVMYLLGPILTSRNNGDSIIIGDSILPGVGLYDALSAVEFGFIQLIPFFVGRQFLGHADSNREIFRALVIAGLVYSIPMLFEIRFSPQLHYWIYGYSPSEFLQSVRDGGFRPMVFMGHGLIVAIFAMMALVSAVTLWRLRDPVVKIPNSAIVGYLSIILVLCKSLGALLYGGALAPLVRFASPKIQVRVAVVIACFSLLYPILRSLDCVPTALMFQVAQAISDDRAASLQFRFNNEDQLLKRAFDKPTFGWGRFGRSRVYSESGRDESVTDGRWIITIGQYGIFGFVAEFGLLLIAVFRAPKSISFANSTRDEILFSALALIVATNVLDLLPNSSLLAWTWLLAGALLGRAESLKARANRRTRPSKGTITTFRDQEQNFNKTGGIPELPSTSNY